MKHAKPYRAAMLAELADILHGGNPPEIGAIPPVFAGPHPKALRLGIRLALLDEYPGANAERLGAWLGKWCSSTAYLSRISRGRNRHDIHGNDYGLITDAERANALDRLAKRKKIRDAKRRPGNGKAPRGAGVRSNHNEIRGTQ